MLVVVQEIFGGRRALCQKLRLSPVAGGAPRILNGGRSDACANIEAMSRKAWHRVEKIGCSVPLPVELLRPDTPIDKNHRARRIMLACRSAGPVKHLP